MADVKFSWFDDFFGIAWRTHAGNPIAVPLFTKLEQATRIAEIIKTWNPKLVHLTFIERNDGNYAICIYEKPDKNVENFGIYRSGMNQMGTYQKIKNMIEKKASMWNPMKVYVQIVHAKDAKDSDTYENMTALLPVSRLEIISEAKFDSDKFTIERNAFKIH